MPVQITTKKVSEVVKKAQLPPAQIEAALGQRNGRDGILVTAFYPLPEDDQVEVSERMGKGENKDKVTSTLTVLGRAVKEDLTYLGEDNERYGVLDGGGNQIQFTGRIFVRVGGEEDDTDATE